MAENLTKDGINIDQKYADGYVKFKLTNIKVFWAKVHEPDTKFEHKWSVDCHLEDGLAGELKKLGFAVNDKTLKDGTVIKNLFKVTKKVRTAKGVENKPPQVVGADGRTPHTEQIGNGSICNLNLSAKAWPIKGTWILSAYLDGVQVVDGVEFGGFDDVSGDTNDF